MDRIATKLKALDAVRGYGHEGLADELRAMKQPQVEINVGGSGEGHEPGCSCDECVAKAAETDAPTTAPVPENEDEPSAEALEKLLSGE